MVPLVHFVLYFTLLKRLNMLKRIFFISLQSLRNVFKNIHLRETCLLLKNTDDFIFGAVKYFSLCCNLAPMILVVILSVYTPITQKVWLKLVSY